MSSGKRSLEKDSSRKLNKFKVAIFIIIIILIIFLIVFSVFNKNKDKQISDNNNTDMPIEEEISDDEENKTIEKIVEEFGGEIIEQVKSDTYYISKDGVEYTAYLDGEIVEGKIIPWSGNETEPVTDENGNIIITTGEDLKWFANQIINGTKNFSGVTVTLAKNIDLGARKNAEGVWEGPTWESIIGYLDEIQTENSENTENESTETQLDPTLTDGTFDVTQENLKRFAGTFIGNGYWIRGMNIDSDKKYQGFFGHLSGTVTNLTIKYSNVKANEIVGTIVGLNGGTVTNCAIENVEISGTEKVGGLVGMNMSSFTIENCKTVGDSCFVNGEKYIGGISGYSNNNSIIKECINTANVSGTDYIGGITGIAFYGSTIDSCINNSKSIKGNQYVGGLVGYSQAQIDSSYNQELNAKIGSISGKTDVGGLVGLNYLMGNITNSFNNGKVIVEEKNAGGIAGLNSANISNCYNTGLIEVTNKAGENIGGICGQNISESFIQSSYNIGKIDSKSIVGGISGSNFGTISTSFYLDSSIDGDVIDGELAKSQENIKDAYIELGDAFEQDSNNINNGYPILIWQRTLDQESN